MATEHGRPVTPQPAAEQKAGDTDNRLILGRRVAGRRPVKVKLYNFRRPDKFSRAQVFSVLDVHRALCRQTVVILDQLLGCNAVAQVVSIDQMNFAEAVAGQPPEGRPATAPLKLAALTGVQMPPMPEAFVVGLDATLTASIVARLCGGSGAAHRDGEPAESSGLTGLEKTLVVAFWRQLSPAIDHAWSVLGACCSRITAVADHPKFVQIVVPNTMVLTVDLELRLGTTVGTLRIVYPYQALQPFLPLLDPRRQAAPDQPPTHKRRQPLSGRLPVQTQVQLRLPDITISQLKTLRKGSTFAIPLAQAGRLTLSAAQTAICTATWDNPRLDQPLRLAPGEQLYAGPNRRTADISEHIDTLLDEVTSRLVKTIENKIGVLRSQSTTTGDDAPNGASDAQEFFDQLTIEHGDILYRALAHDQAQTQAAVLCRLSNPLAADFVTRLDATRRADVLQRVISMTQLQPLVPTICADYLGKLVADTDNTAPDRNGGIDKAADILNYVPASVERDLVQSWETTNPDLAETIKQHLFVFDDIVMLSADTLEKLISIVERSDLLRAFKTAGPHIRDYLAKTLGPEASRRLLADAASLGPVRIKDVEAAQTRIITQLRELDLAGEVVVMRPNEVVQ